MRSRTQKWLAALTVLMGAFLFQSTCTVNVPRGAVLVDSFTTFGGRGFDRGWGGGWDDGWYDDGYYFDFFYTDDVFYDDFYYGGSYYGGSYYGW